MTTSSGYMVRLPITAPPFSSRRDQVLPQYHQAQRHAARIRYRLDHGESFPYCRHGCNLVAEMKTVFTLAILSVSSHAADTVKTANGVLEGTLNPATGIRMFKGVPFAQPPVGDLRWKEPERPKDWTGVRKAGQFGPR